MTRDLTDEEKAIVYVDNTHCKYNEVLSRPYVVHEIRKAYIAGLTQERKELQAQIEKMKSLLKEVFEEYGFGEKEDSGLQPGDSVQYVRQKLYCYFT